MVTLFAIAFLIGVFDTKDEGPPGVPGIGPVEQGRAHQTHVWRAGGRGTKAHSHISAGRRGEEVSHERPV